MSPLNPQFEPPWLKYHPSPRFSMDKPIPNGPTPTGQTIRARGSLGEHGTFGAAHRCLHFDDETSQITGRGPKTRSGLLGIHVPRSTHRLPLPVMCPGGAAGERGG